MGTEFSIFGSGTKIIIGIVKTIHHKATVIKEILMAVSELGMPNVCGYRYISTLIENKSPPPR